jgi:hypothetical protein
MFYHLQEGTGSRRFPVLILFEYNKKRDTSMKIKCGLYVLTAFALVLGTNMRIHAEIPVKIGGYLQNWLILQQHQDQSDLDTWGFRIRRARLSAHADLNDVFSLTSWFEFAGVDRNLLDFFATARINPYLNVRAGVFRPSGQMYDTGILPSGALLFYERPLISSRLADNMGYDAFRDIGIMMNGSYKSLAYSFHIGNGMGRFVQAGTNIRSRDFGGALFGGRIDISPVKGLSLGGHASANRQKNVLRDGMPQHDIDRYSYSFRFAADDVIIPRFFTHLEAGGGSVDDLQRFDFSGWYLEGGYRTSRNFTLLVRYDRYEEDPAVGVTRTQENVTAGGIYYFYYNDREMVRTGVNYGFGSIDPGGNNNHIFLLWFQVRFPS